MWYDATSAAGSLEAADSPVKGKIGYVAAPVVQDPELRLALRLVVEHPAGQRRRRTTPGSSSPGPPASSTRNWSASSSAGPGCRPASAPRRTRTRTTSRRRRRSPSRPRHAISSADPRQPRRAAAPGDRHPVHRHPRVHRPRHPGVAVRQLRDRRADERRRGAGTRPAARRRRRRALPVPRDTAEGGAAHDIRGRDRPVRAGRHRRPHRRRAPAAPGRRLGPPGAAAARARSS